MSRLRSLRDVVPPAVTVTSPIAVPGAPVPTAPQSDRASDERQGARGQSAVNGGDGRARAEPVLPVRRRRRRRRHLRIGLVIEGGLAIALMVDSIVILAATWVQESGHGLAVGTIVGAVLFTSALVWLSSLTMDR